MTTSKPTNSDTTKTAGVLFGAAYGDALAAPVEFTHEVSNIRATYPPLGPDDIHQGRVTDDTQMMLAVGRAIAETPELTATHLEPALRHHFTVWLHDPQNNRAPGMTCLKACQALETGIPWPQATILGSKGCGANMRVQPLAFIHDQRTRAGAAQFQAALTHGHATALTASDLTAQAISCLLQGISPQDLPTTLLNYAHSQRTTYHHDWLSGLWELTPERTPENFIARGWDECLTALESAETAARTGIGKLDDPCQYGGEGWIAEEALATGLLCFLLHPQDPVHALQRAATTSGDSDSIACITGSLLGAHLGHSAFPADWRTRIEYHDELNSLADQLAQHPATQ